MVLEHFRNYRRPLPGGRGSEFNGIDNPIKLPQRQVGALAPEMPNNDFSKLNTGKF
jgi:hypothetical protein